MIAESTEYIKSSNGEALNKFIMDEYDKMCDGISALSQTSVECTKAAKYSIKDQLKYHIFDTLNINQVAQIPQLACFRFSILYTLI